VQAYISFHLISFICRQTTHCQSHE